MMKNTFKKKKLFYWWFRANKMALFRSSVSRHIGDFYCLICLHSFRTKEKSNSHEKASKNCEVVMPNDENKILKYNHSQKLIKIRFVIFDDFETPLKKWSNIKNYQNLLLLYIIVSFRLILWPWSHNSYK